MSESQDHSDAEMIRQTLASCCGDEAFSPHDWMIHHSGTGTDDQTLIALGALDRLVAENAWLREALATHHRPDLSRVPARGV